MVALKNREVLIWLNSLNISNKNIDLIMEQIPHLNQLPSLKERDIYSLKGIKNQVLEKIIKNRNKSYIESLFREIEENNIDTITVLDKDYPEGLHHIYDSPKVLYKKGDVLEKDKMAIAIVGSRKSTQYGQWATEKFVKELVNMDVTIVSGLALGIDSVAHKTALETGGRTIAILGNGLDTIYPKRNKGLYEEIPTNGAILTEYPLGTPPLAYNFPQRNRMISGLSLGIIVIEAKEKSGSLITAYHALEQGKEVFALPGNINSIFSRGTNKLIKDGAKILMDVEDIIEEIYELQQKVVEKKKGEIDYSDLSSLEIEILEIIQEGPIHGDIITAKTGIDISTINGILTILELKGLIKELAGRTFTLS